VNGCQLRVVFLQRGIRGDQVWQHVSAGVPGFALTPRHTVFEVVLARLSRTCAEVMRLGMRRRGSSVTRHPNELTDESTTSDGRVAVPFTSSAHTSDNSNAGAWSRRPAARAGSGRALAGATLPPTGSVAAAPAAAFSPTPRRTLSSSSSVPRARRTTTGVAGLPPTLRGRHRGCQWRGCEGCRNSVGVSLLLPCSVNACLA
jgi:hypothetical protein